MRAFTFLLVWLILLMAAFAGGYYAYLNQPSIQPPAEWPFRPRPRPPEPEPPPAPLEADDARLFARLRGHIEKAADQRAKAQVEAFTDEVTRQLETANSDGVVTDGPLQFIGTSLLVSAIITVVKKIVYAIVLAIVGAAIIALLWKFWFIVAPVFVLAVTIVAWPIAFAAAKLAQPAGKKE